MIEHPLRLAMISGTPAAEERWREMTRKLKNVTLSIPAKNIAPVLASTCSTVKTSSKNEMKLVTALFKTGYADLNNASLGVSAISRKRNFEVKTDAKKFRDTFCILQKI